MCPYSTPSIGTLSLKRRRYGREALLHGLPTNPSSNQLHVSSCTHKTELYQNCMYCTTYPPKALESETVYMLSR